VPLYEYKCLKCGRRTEKIEPVSGPHLKKCPHCAGKVEALISAPSIKFKGSGWYVTDYAGKSPATGDSAKDEKSSSEKKDDASKDASKDSSKDSGKDSAKDSGKDSGSKESSAKETKDTKEKKSEKSSNKNK
jgi:putative FmdB family regulatory protein